MTTLPPGTDGVPGGGRMPTPTVEAGDLKLDRRLEHQGHFTFPLSHYHGITIGFTLPLAVQSLKEWVREFPVDLVRLSGEVLRRPPPQGDPRGALCGPHLPGALCGAGADQTALLPHQGAGTAVCTWTPWKWTGGQRSPTSTNLRWRKSRPPTRLLTGFWRRQLHHCGTFSAFLHPCHGPEGVFQVSLRPAGQYLYAEPPHGPGRPFFCGRSPRPAWRRSPDGWAMTGASKFAGRVQGCQGGRPRWNTGGEGR